MPDRCEKCGGSITPHPEAREGIRVIDFAAESAKTHEALRKRAADQVDGDE